MSVNVNYSDQCLLPPTVPFPKPILLYAGEDDIIVCNSCCQISSTKTKIRVNRKCYVLNIEHSILGYTVYILSSSVSGCVIIVFVIS